MHTSRKKFPNGDIYYLIIMNFMLQACRLTTVCKQLKEMFLSPNKSQRMRWKQVREFACKDVDLKGSLKQAKLELDVFV